MLPLVSVRVRHLYAPGGSVSRGSHWPVRLVPSSAGEGEPVDELLDARDVSALLKVRLKRVYELGIPTVRVGPRTLRWRRTDLEAWVSERRGAA
jgi:predicted DNA-binding transcriptional regulator AlpA